MPEPREVNYSSSGRTGGRRRLPPKERTIVADENHPADSGRFDNWAARETRRRSRGATTPTKNSQAGDAALQLELTPWGSSLTGTRCKTLRLQNFREFPAMMMRPTSGAKTTRARFQRFSRLKTRRSRFESKLPAGSSLSAFKRTDYYVENKKPSRLRHIGM